MRGLGKRPQPVEEMFTHLKTRGNESPEGILQMFHSHVTGPIDYLKNSAIFTGICAIIIICCSSIRMEDLEECERL